IIPAFQRRNQLQALPVVFEEDPEMLIFLRRLLLVIHQYAAGLFARSEEIQIHGLPISAWISL
ncbi:MAG TPA: hypothetical protein VN300_09420, partial [Desulfobacterales bacterium]|nr:hypothetical protein [Desulfobacterales bacterium]